MIKLIVSDMDGTLVDSNHKINEEFCLRDKLIKA